MINFSPNDTFCGYADFFFHRINAGRDMNDILYMKQNVFSNVSTTGKTKHPPHIL